MGTFNLEQGILLSACKQSWLAARYGPDVLSSEGMRTRRQHVMGLMSSLLRGWGQKGISLWWPNLEPGAGRMTVLRSQLPKAAHLK